MLFFDPVNNEHTRATAVCGAIIVGLVIGMALHRTTARIIVRVFGPLWRAVVIVLAWLAVSFFLMVVILDDVLPAAHERAPLITLTVMLVILGVLTVFATPFIPARNLTTGTKHGKNSFEELNLKGWWTYAFLQFGGFFYGFGYTGFLLTVLGFATVNPAEVTM